MSNTIERGVLGGIVGLLAVFTLPFMILNLTGGIVAGIWLAVLGEWWAIGLGVGLFFVSSFGLALALMPSFVVAWPAAYLYSKGFRVLT